MKIYIISKKIDGLKENILLTSNNILAEFLMECFNDPCVTYELESHQLLESLMDFCTDKSPVPHGKSEHILDSKRYFGAAINNE